MLALTVLTWQALSLSMGPVRHRAASPIRHGAISACDGSDDLNFLQTKLHRAVADEDYEAAAMLRDKIERNAGVAGVCDWGHDCDDCGARALSSDTYGMCYTDYAANQASLPMELGCAPNKQGMKLTGDDWNGQLPGVLAAEWTADFVKIFYIPDSQMPADLATRMPSK